VQYVGSNYGQDISNELQNKITVTLVEPVHTTEVLTRHAARELMTRTCQTNIQRARRAQESIQQAAVHAGTDPDAPMKLALLQNEIACAFSANMDVPIELNDSEKTQFSNEWRTYIPGTQLLTGQRTVYADAPRQDEAGYRLEYVEHIL
jgi:hypothetical protein